MGVCECGPDLIFEYQGNVFFGSAEHCACECSEDIETGVCLGVHVFSVHVVW